MFSCVWCTRVRSGSCFVFTTMASLRYDCLSYAQWTRELHRQWHVKKTIEEATYKILTLKTSAVTLFPRPLVDPDQFQCWTCPPKQTDFTSFPFICQFGSTWLGSVRFGPVRLGSDQLQCWTCPPKQTDFTSFLFICQFGSTWLGWVRLGWVRLGSVRLADPDELQWIKSSV